MNCLVLTLLFTIFNLNSSSSDVYQQHEHWRWGKMWGKKFLNGNFCYIVLLFCLFIYIKMRKMVRLFCITLEKQKFLKSFFVRKFVFDLKKLFQCKTYGNFDMIHCLNWKKSIYHSSAQHIPQNRRIYTIVSSLPFFHHIKTYVKIQFTKMKNSRHFENLLGPKMILKIHKRKLLHSIILNTIAWLLHHGNKIL